ncbi:membrane integrity-associated transporter subunit PqiC [Pseudescherichia vulneris]|uniref:membrane integrity-associated transporter subunit PqiC n=1 Tax=Pseudescherichia vulneris TaxID=566 RepID=UPI00227A59BD|nr:membrane integrity-associated transporter subunit PqiC [Pseudescherichia vulneris]WAH53394.1 membrane integrity-associated transporter subunit PqiC [Pseudescherichia vulneris]
MKKGIMAIAVLLLSACSSGNEEPRYYQLPSSPQPATVSAGMMDASTRQGQRQLWIEQVSVPDYLAGNGVVYQTSDVEYDIANNNLWASPLDQQLRTSLVANLSRDLPGWVVASQPMGSEQDTLNVTVTGFHGRYDGHVIVSGEWLLNHQGTLIKRPFYVEMTQSQDGYDAMVKALGVAWAQQASNMAREITRLP